MFSESLFRKKFRSLNISKKFMYSFNLGFANSRHEHPDYHVPDNVILNNKSPHNPERDVFFSSSQDLAIDVSQSSFVTDITDSLRFEQNENSFAEERNEFKIEFGPESNEVAVDVPDDFVPCFKSPPTSPRHTSATSLEASRFSFDHPLSSISTDVRQWNKSKELSRNSTPISKMSPTSPTYKNSCNFNFGNPLNYKNSVVGREALIYEQTQLNSTFGRPTEKIRDAVDFPEISPTYPRSPSASGLVRNCEGKVKHLQTFDQVLAAVVSLDSETAEEEETVTRKKLLKELKTEVLERVKMEVNLISVNKINSINELKQNVEIMKIVSQLNKSKILLDYKNRSTKIILQEIVSQCVNSLRVSENYNEASRRPPLQNNQSYISNHLLKLANEWSNTAPGNFVASSTTSESPFSETNKTGIFKKRKKKSEGDCYFRRKVMSDQMVEITINKSFEPLGLTLYDDGRSVKIRRIVTGGMAEKSGYFHKGDEILMINKVNVKYKPIHEISAYLENLTGKIVFLISPKSPEVTRRQFSRYVIISFKAQFNYDPAEDNLISHPGNGLKFQKGDILHVTDQKDKKWWNAYRNDERDQPIEGFIPSIEFLTMRHQFLESLNTEEWTSGDSRKKLKVKKKNKKKSSEETNTYEEVVLYNPRTYFTRPIVIIGPRNLFQKEFMLALKKSGLFDFGVTHTSRPKQVEEVEGINQYFVSRSRFKAMISANEFIRYGKFGKYLYGLSFDSMRTIAKSGKTGMFYYVDPVSIKPIRDNGLMPYVVYFQSPLVERWKTKKLELQNETQDVFRRLVQECINIEDNYGHYIDATFLYSSASEAFEEIVNKVNFLSSHLQWVPATWVQNKHYSL